MNKSSSFHLGCILSVSYDAWIPFILVELEGEIFYTATGLPFTYKVIDDHQIKPYREGKSRWTISKALIEKAMAQPRWNGTEFNKTIVASSYVAGILNDARLGK